MCVLSAPRQMSHQCHFEEIARRIDAMVVQMQLVTEMSDALARFAQRHLTRFGAHSYVEFAVSRGATLRIGRHELTHRTGLPMRGLLELHLRNDDIVFNDRPAIRAHGIATATVHLDIG